MPELTEFARRIVARHLTESFPGGEQIPIAALASLDDVVHDHGSTMVHCCIRETLVRLAETHILGHPSIFGLVELWDGIVGTARDRIEVHLVEILGVRPHPELVTHVFRCLSGSAAQRGRQSGAHQPYFSDLLDRVSNSSPSKELRCEICGYHFRVKDVSNDRARTIRDAGLSFAKSLFPGRSNDSMKPIQRKNDSLTRLSIDHVVPEETLGWSEVDNLEILCMFCNLGKMAYRRPFEAISSFAVGALADAPRGRSFGTLKHQIVVATLRSQGGECARCGRSKCEAEVTVRSVLRAENTVLQGFAPWNLQTLCYTCVSELPEDDMDDESSGSAGLDADQSALGVPSSESLD